LEKIAHRYQGFGFVKNQMGNEIRWVLKCIKDRYDLHLQLTPEEQEVLEHILKYKFERKFDGIDYFQDDSGVKPKKIKVTPRQLLNIMKHDIYNRAFRGSSSWFSDIRFVHCLLESSSSPIKLTEKIQKKDIEGIFERVQVQKACDDDINFYRNFSQIMREETI
jgi:hypothetical protein